MGRAGVVCGTYTAGVVCSTGLASEIAENRKI